MNTLSRYDIADVVSHISSKTEVSDTETKGGASFGALLTKAIDGAPDSKVEGKVEGKVAESGKNPPDSFSALQSTGQKNGDAVESLESKFHSDLDPSIGLALFDSFSRGQEISNSPELVSQKEIIEAGVNRKVNSEENTRLELSGEKEIKAGVHNKVNSEENTGLGISGEEEIADSGKTVRVTTLKHKRPVILGPGHVDGKIQSASGGETRIDHFPNYYRGDAYGDNDAGNIEAKAVNFQQAYQENESDAHSVIAPVKFRGKIESLEKLSNDLELSSNKTKESAGDKSLLNHAKISGTGELIDIEKKDTAKPVKYNEAQSEKHEVLQNVEQLFKNKPTSTNPSTVIKGDRLISVSSEKLQRQELKASVLQEKAVQPYAFDEILPHDAKYLRANYSGTKNINSEIQEELYKSTQSSDNESEEEVISHMINKNKYSMPEKGSAVIVNQSVGSKDKKYEFKELSRKNIAKTEIKDTVEILINNDKMITEKDLLRTTQISQKSALKDIDSNINGVKNSSIEAAHQEPLIGHQIDKPSLQNRSETLSKPVLVSNFNSEIQKTIVGQLTNSAKGVTKFTVALFPESFGKVSIEISYSESAGLKINMVGDNPAATSILEQNLPSLRENLQSEKLSELIVNLNSNRDSQNSNNRNSKSENEKSRDNAEKTDASIELAESNSSVTQKNQILDSDNGLDTYV